MSDDGLQVSPYEQREEARRERARAHITRRRQRASSGNRGVGLERLAALLVGLSLAAGVAAGRSLARGERPLERVTVLGASRLSAEEVVRESGVAPGASLAALDAQAIAASVARHPRVADAQAVVASGQLLVEIEERVAVATASQVADPGAAALAVDAAGLAFAPATPEEREALPQLRVAGSLQLGAEDPELARGAELAARAAQEGISALEAVEVSAKGDPAGLSLRLRGIAPRFVLGRSDPDAALARLKELLEAGLEEIGASREIDLRFADQAVMRSDAPDSAPAEQALASPS